MNGLGKYIWAALALAVMTHAVVLYAMPRVLMGVVTNRVAHGSFNVWRPAARVTETSRTIVRPSPDLAYSACPYDLGAGPVRISVRPWHTYWSLSLYQDNSDNFFVVEDRESRGGADVTLIQRGAQPPEHAVNVVESPSTRGIALIRRLAPTQSEYNAASEIAKGDICATVVRAAKTSSP